LLRRNELPSPLECKMNAASEGSNSPLGAPDCLDQEEGVNDTKEDRPEPPLSVPRGVIQLLSNEVVQQIAAGEVVQRASSAIKELLENSIDAAADTIRVSMASAACSSFSVVDNGTGICKADLSLACTRHATSKIRTYQDLRSISSFGFRGEALAALSMVSRVTIASKTATTNDANSGCAYQMQYTNGRSNAEEPTRTARTVGTTIQVNDLFYNLPHRQSNKKSSASTEYQSILKVLQSYAIHHAPQGIAISCQKHGTAVADVNTAPFVAAIQKALRTLRTRQDVTLADDTSSDSKEAATVRALQEAATKNAIGHTFGSHLLPFLLSYSSALYGRERRNATAPVPASQIDPLHIFDTDDEKKEEKDIISEIPDVAAADISSRASSEQPQPLIYSCTGYITSPSLFQSSELKKKVGLQRSTPIVLFINHRFIEGCSVLRRSVEDVYVKCCKQKPPFLYLSIHVPPNSIDVNVHPTKREVVLLHMDEIRTHLAQHIKEQLESVGYTVPNIAPSDPPTQTGTLNPYQNDKKRKLSQSHIALDPPTGTTTWKQNSSSKAPVILPKNKIRTTRSLQSGSLEPFLVPRSSLSQETQSQEYVSESQNSIHSPSQEDSTSTPPSSMPDEPVRGPALDPKCPLHDSAECSTTDLAIPGAFATLAALCNCRKKVTLDLSQTSDSQGVGLPIRLAAPSSGVSTSHVAAAGRALRLQRLSPTSCSYTSIQQLRKRTFSKCRDEEWEKKLRGACFVGTVSHHRTLMQCGEELVLINHFACAQELFYQLALNRFGGGCGVAKTQCPSENGTASGIDIEAVIGHFVQMEELLHQPALNLDDVSSWSLPIKVSETNQALANQASACLLQHADMLLEYYSLRIEKDSTTGKAHLAGLPVLIEGFEPSPHGLPLFLLRLASEVDWSEEKPCFHGICRELGSYYAQLPSNGNREDHTGRVQHTLFPAITTLLIPTKEMKQRNDFITLTSLPKLFRVFERC
jgi:DNA mismatch repair protein MutL